ncbi:MAG: NAD(P)-dependent oxidoreductase [Saprospiraceae bacterium]
MKKLLVTGISGFVASHFATIKSSTYEIVGTYRTRSIVNHGMNCFAVDWSEVAAAEQFFKQQKPDAVLHLAALSNPNYCEQHPAASQAVNVDVAVHLAKLCQQAQIPFLFSSTDLVFDGKKAPYGEEDLAEPICVYGQHKLQAETEILSLYPASIIARLPLMFGWSTQGGFMKNWIDQLKAGKTIAAFTDEYRTPVSAGCALQGMLLLLENACTGRWHLGGEESISRYDLAKLIAQAYGLPTELLQASLQKEVQLPAARPPNVSLDSKKAFALGYQPKKINAALQELATQAKRY